MPGGRLIRPRDGSSAPLREMRDASVMATYDISAFSSQDSVAVPCMDRCSRALGGGERKGAFCFDWRPEAVDADDARVRC